MKENWIRHSVIGMMVISAFTVSGCAAVGLFSNDHTYGAKENWEIKTPPPHVLDAIAETGRSMGLGVDYWEVKNPSRGLGYWETKSPPPVDENDTRSRSIMLSDDELGGLKAVLIGKQSVSGLTFYAWQGGKYMEVYVMVAGNFGSGTQKAATKLLSDFKTKLSKRVGQIIVIHETQPADTPGA